MDELVAHFVIMCNSKPPIPAVEFVAHRKWMRATITLVLEFRGVNIIIGTQKVTNYVTEIVS